MNQDSRAQERNIQRMKESLDALQRYVDELAIFLPLPFCTVNSHNIILGVNQAFKDLTGYAEVEVIGNGIDFIFLEKDNLEIFKKKVPEKRERITEEFTLVRKDRTMVPVSVSALARTDDNNNFLGYFLTISDISESKKFQEKLEQKVEEKTKDLERKTKELSDSQRAVLNILEDTEEARKEVEGERNKTMAIITNFTDGILVFNKDDTVDLVNPKAEKMIKVDSSDVVGKKLSDLKKNEEMADFAKAIAQSPDFGAKKENEEDSFRGEIQTESGSTIEIITVPIFRDSEKAGTLAVLHDITREKRVEEAKSEFVSIAAHQLRTPLSAIKWTITMLLDGDLGELNDAQKNLVEKTYASNERMVGLINDLLNVSRIEEGRYLYKPSRISFNEIIDPLIDTYKPEFKRRGINLKVKIPKEKLPFVAVDIEKITLVIQNFLDNAMKYTSKGGETVVSVTPKKEEIELAVKDTGVGIPKDQQERLFSKFFRAANVIRMETEGSGLGLFICRNIINAHKGKIWFNSEEGKGSAFYFSLPIMNNKKKFEEFLKTL